MWKVAACLNTPCIVVLLIILINYIGYLVGICRNGFDSVEGSRRNGIDNVLRLGELGMGRMVYRF